MSGRLRLAVAAVSVVVFSTVLGVLPASARVDSPSGFADGITRLAGASRYETAIQVSKQYAPGVPAVFVATGTNFPDALSAAAAAASVGGPLLLTMPTSLPASVKAEIQRLAPAKIYVIGGKGAVSASVAIELAKIAPVTRFGGANRYDTGLQIVNGTFSSSSTAILATGRSFPDALAATGVAGTLNAPVILVDGVKSTLTSATLTTLSSLGVKDVVIAGGTGVVSSGIATQLRNKGYAVTLYGGADRYATAALLNSHFFPQGSSDTMFLATGTNFPDALAGAALAGRLGAPLYITTPTCVPTSIYDSVSALAPTKTAVLGGTAVVSSNAAKNQSCTPVTTDGFQHAVKSAQSYLDFIAFSRSDLIGQLVYDGFTSAQATYGVDHVGANWNAQAVLSAQSYLDFMAFSRSDLIGQLVYDGFTTAQATYGVDQLGADWNAQAVLSAQSYLDFMAFSRSDLIGQLVYDGFTTAQATYGVDQVGL